MEQLREALAVKTVMNNLFAASSVKVKRAVKHIQELEELLARHEAEHPPVVTVTQSEQGRVERIHVASKAPPTCFSAIVGDVVHNLRASLDLMAVELVTITSPELSTKSVHFPFSEVATGLESAIKRRDFHRAGDDAVTLLKSLQPYKGGNAALRGLHDLDTKDKHSALIPDAATIVTPMVRANTDNFPDIYIEMVEGTLPDVKTVFPKDSPFGGEEIIPTLHGLIDLTERILESFRSLVADRQTTDSLSSS